MIDKEILDRIEVLEEKMKELEAFDEVKKVITERLQRLLDDIEEML